MTRTIILVGIGGGIGSICRYLTSVFIAKYAASTFPWATFVANILGCLLIGLLVGFLTRHHLTNSDLTFLLVTGFCGGYTTFSAFAYENVHLLQSGHLPAAFLNVAVSVVIGLLAVWAGLSLSAAIPMA